LFILSQNETRR